MNVCMCVISNSCICLRFKGICGFIIVVYIIYFIYNGIYNYKKFVLYEIFYYND